MSKQNTKVKSLSFEVIRNVSMMLLVVNLLVIGNIAFWVSYSIEKSEKQYMSEVINRLSTEMNSELQRYIDATIGISVNSVIVEKLSTTPNLGLMDTANDQALEDELNVMLKVFGDVLLHASVGSIASDSLLDHEGTKAGSSFSLSKAPYYSAITEQRLVITDSYSDTNTGKTIITMAYPVYGTSGEVVGLVALDLLVEKLSSFVTNTSYGDSGTTFMLDKNDAILVAPSSVTSSSEVNNVTYEGDDLKRELENPTGEIIKFTSGGVARMGGIALVENAGWKLVSAVDVSDFQSRANLIVSSLSIMQIVLFIFGILISSRFIHFKLAPIKLIQDYMHNISEGNLQSSLEYQSDDEMGALVEDIQTMSDTLFMYINHISDTIHDFANGNIQISNSVEYIGDFAPVHNSMEDFVQLMSGSLSDLKRAVEEVGSGAHQISNGATSLANGSQEQASSVEELNTLISHVNDEITETAKYSSKISGYAGNITGDIQKNNEKMKDLATNVQQIKDHSDEVKRIIKAIEEVAFQTNILALNAAVEAARAGESGKGFAVVADEVRNLSLKTSEAVQDTTKIITEMAMFVESSTDLAHETSNDLQKIVNEAQGFVENMANISHSTNDQSNAISEIHSGIEQISHVVHQNSAISEQSAAATEELSAQATLMSELIEKFKLD